MAGLRQGSFCTGSHCTARPGRCIGWSDVPGQKNDYFNPVHPRQTIPGLVGMLSSIRESAIRLPRSVCSTRRTGCLRVGFKPTCVCSHGRQHRRKNGRAHSWCKMASRSQRAEVPDEFHQRAAVSADFIGIAAGTCALPSATCARGVPALSFACKTQRGPKRITGIETL